MEIVDIVQRAPLLVPWAEGEKIPWDEPEFSQRMLKEHLSQAHDAASRRTEIIDQHVTWIHTNILNSQPARILDLGCGPGLYLRRLAELGHDGTGIDFSPASIDYARQQSPDRCAYIQGDIRHTDFGSGYDLAMLIFGEFNTFKPDDALLILRKARAALKSGGALLVEAHTHDAVREIGERPATWSSAARGLFSDQPHLTLYESSWQAEHEVAIERWYVTDAASGVVTRYADSMQAYTDEAYRALLAECGFTSSEFNLSLAGDAVIQAGLMVMIGQK
jgi:SAM-dependent methyltransferase